MTLQTDPMAIARSHLPVKKNEVKILTATQIIRQIIDLTTDLFLVSFIFLFESKLINKVSKILKENNKINDPKKLFYNFNSFKDVSLH